MRGSSGQAQRRPAEAMCSGEARGPIDSLGSFRRIADLGRESCADRRAKHSRARFEKLGAVSSRRQRPDMAAVT